MIDNLGVVEDIKSEIEIEILSIGEGKNIIVQASKDYIQEISGKLQDNDGFIIIEYDQATNLVNENIKI